MKKFLSVSGIILILLLSASLIFLVFTRNSTGSPSFPDAADSEQPSELSAQEQPKESEYAGKIIISEIMYRNSSSFAGPGLDFPDYIELQNISQSEIQLSGWSLSDREDELKWSFPQCSIAPGEFLLVCCSDGNGDALNCSFSLSEGEILYLFDAEGIKLFSAECEALPEGCSLALNADGESSVQRWISPGYENSPQGHEDFSSSQVTNEGIIINEVVVSPFNSWEKDDWIELKNNSPESISLSGYYLSDDGSDMEKWPLPDVSLSPGEKLIIACTGGEAPETPYRIYSDFSLNSKSEDLFLTNPQGELSDFVYLHDIPAGGSMGRLNGENGFFYMPEPSPGEENHDGKRRISEPPVLLNKDGVFDSSESVTAGLSADGAIYYTTDGSLPTEDSELYTQELSFDSSCVLRAVAVEEGALPSPAITGSYIINENHTLPVLSLVTDYPANFRDMFIYGRKGVELQGNLALYNDPAAFNHRCSVEMKGFTSLGLPKKSMGVSFKGCHGGKLNADLFQNGVTEFSNLSIRAGQDYTFSIFRNELFQELCLEASDSLYTQASKYCILYVNGSYYGIYCLKEDLNSQFYASHCDVSKSSVESIKFPAPMGCSFWNEVLEFCWNNDMSVDENYEHICSLMDVDSFIDWIIFEGYSGNTDIQGNLKIFRSPENGNKWQFSFYDLDWAFYASDDFNILFNYDGNTGYLMPSLIDKMFDNPNFQEKFLLRFKELNESTLSNQHVLEKIDELQALLDAEVPRERQRWDLEYSQWLSRVDELRDYITGPNREILNIDHVCSYMGLSDDERAEFFGR